MIDDAKAAASMFGASPKPIAEPTATPASPLTPQQSEAPKTAAEKLYGGPKRYVSPFGDVAQPEAEKPQADSAPKEEPKPEAKTEAEGETKAQVEPADMEAVLEAATEHGFDASAPLTLEFAEATQGLGTEGVTKLLDLQRRSNEQAWNDLSDSWVKEAKASPTFDTDVEAARSVLRDHSSPELMEVLNTYRVGNHPAVIKFLASVAKGRR